MKTRVLAFLLASFISLYAQAESLLPYPEIQNLEADDIFFHQYGVAVASARKAIASLDSTVDMTPEFYTYVVKPNDTIISIAARCCIPYDAIVSLNRLATAEEDIVGKRLIIPSLPALYVYDDPDSAFERLLLDYVNQLPSDFEGFEILVFFERDKGKIVYCLPNALFDGNMRNFFFMPYYQYPLPNGVGWISSKFGIRKDPFTMKDSSHSGIDIAAPTGTPVYSIAAGIVTKILYDRILGNHIIVQHKDGRESVYGHLSKVFVLKNEFVRAGTKLGAVGTTGRSTGSHLHLEIRESSCPVDPAKFVQGLGL
ncbi:MAG: M23 family metallopeptidase [Treponemataceae bacterium]